MKKTLRVCAAVCAVLFVVVALTGCASNRPKVKVNQKEVLVDWANRGLGADPSPKWLEKLVSGSTTLCIKEFGLEKGSIVKCGIGTAQTSKAALEKSRLNYNTLRAEELRTTVTSVIEEVTGTSSADYQEASMKANATLSGHEVIAQFWQEKQVTKKGANGKSETSTEFVAYTVYTVPKEDWAATVKAFMQSVVAELSNPNMQKTVAGCTNEVYNRTASSRDLSDDESRVAMESQIADLRRADERSAKSGVASKVGNALDALELAYDIFF